jgi:hypothetical protein
MEGRKVTIELLAGNYPSKRWPCKSDLDGQIEALKRAIDGKPKLGIDDTFNHDTLTILESIQKQLPE